MGVHEVEEARSLYQRAAQQVTDYPDQASSDYVQSERECGSLDSWLESKQWSQMAAQNALQPESSSGTAAAAPEEPMEEGTAKKGPGKKKKRQQAKEQKQE